MFYGLRRIVNQQLVVGKGRIVHHGKRHEHEAHDEDENGEDFADEVHTRPLLL